MLAVDTALVALLCFGAVWQWRFRMLLPLVVISFTQNFVVPFLYTTGIAGPNACKALIFAKEFLLLFLVTHAAWRLLGRGARLNNALLILVAMTLWCVARGIVAIAQGDHLADACRMIRNMCFPAQAFIVGASAAYEGTIIPNFLRKLVPLLTTMGLLAVLMFRMAGSDFFVKYVNVAAYNIELKGEDPGNQVEDSGISGSSEGRPEFSFLSEFRAFGTFGEPISMAFSMAFAILLISFGEKPGLKSCLQLLPIALALLLSFTRSAWIFLAFALLTVAVRKRRYKLIVALGITLALLFIVFSPLTSFLFSSLDKLANADPNDLHSVGLRGFYTMAWHDPGNVLGKGTMPGVQRIPESGYAFLLEHFGLPAYCGFLVFHFTMFTMLFRARPENGTLALIGQGVLVANLITMHTSFYALSFIPFLPVWILLGALSTYATPIHDLNPGTIAATAEQHAY